jgi:hypothetical protein
MIKYQAFNPIAGKYEQAQTIDDAVILKNQIQENYCLFQNVGQVYNDPTFYKANQLLANEFIAIKEGIAGTQYDYSIYNATTKTYTNQVFIAEDAKSTFLIKVLDGVVTEWYQQEGEIDGVKHSYISLDLTTGNPIEYYDIVGSVMSKYSLDGTFIVSTYLGDYSTIPQEKRTLLNEFLYSSNIFAWSDKEYGFIVEYKRYDLIPYSDCNEEQKLELDQEKQNFIFQNSELFAVNQETTNTDGSVTWTVVDTSNW